MNLIYYRRIIILRIQIESWSHNITRKKKKCMTIIFRIAPSKLHRGNAGIFRLLAPFSPCALSFLIHSTDHYFRYFFSECKFSTLHFSASNCVCGVQVRSSDNWWDRSAVWCLTQSWSHIRSAYAHFYLSSTFTLVFLPAY